MDEMMFDDHGGMDYAEIKRLAREYGVKIDDLLALSPANDPFYVGRETALKQAEWFAHHFWRLAPSFVGKVHLRRVHYRFSHGEEDVYKHDGSLYENTDNDWSYLNLAATYARHLKLVPRDALVDRRNPQPVINADPLDAPRQEEIGWDVEFEEWGLPWIETYIGVPDWDPPEFEARGYDYHDSMQPYLLEVWCEKTTLDDVLKPLCRRYGANYISGAGFLSITAVTNMLRRRALLGKPCRILYLSDFDPGGVQMPVSVARQIEHQLRTEGHDPDLKLDPVAVTLEQIGEHELPRKEIDDGDHRKDSFEERLGEGHVELDALEALVPGKIAEELSKRFDGFIDRDLEGRVNDAREEAERVLREKRDEIMEPYGEELDEMRDKLREIVERYEEELERLDEEMRAEVRQALRGEEEEDEEEGGEDGETTRLDEIHEEIEAKLESLEPELPNLPEPEVEEDEAAKWLFDGNRGYLEQLDHYRVYKGLDPLDDLIEQKRLERMRRCEWCKGVYESGAKHGQYCSKSCKMKAHRWRKKNALGG